MKPVKTIAAVGVSADLLQELKQAIEQSAERLDSQWEWASEQSPDLLVVDPGEFSARMARTRAQVTGVRYVVVGDAAKHATDRFVLLQPFRRDALAAVLNAAGSATVASSAFARHDDSFYSVEYEGGEAPEGLPEDLPATPARDWASGTAQGLDELMRGDPLAEPAPDPAKVTLPADASVQLPGVQTRRSAARADQSLERLGRAGAEGSPSAAPPPKVPGIDMPSVLPPMPASDNAGYPLLEYLRGGLLGGPARIAIEDAPPLALDPKQSLFHAGGDLAALAAYFSRPLLRREWHALNSTELAEARDAAPGRSYRQLQWLEAMLRGDGRLAGHLDPGGSYRVPEPFVVDPGFRGHGRIVAALSQPARLHEVAAAAQVSMEQAFDIVNAYDAVGLLEWKPRPPRHATPAAASGGGLLSRLGRRLRGF